MLQKLYKSSYVKELKDKLNDKTQQDLYLKTDSPFSEDNTYITPDLDVPESFELMLPEQGDNHDFENSKTIFGIYKKMTPVQATDTRIWTYLTHRICWNYLRARRPVESQPENNRVSYILDHWFINGLNPRNLMRNDISLLWWCAYLSYDDKRENPFELTKEVFTMLDYTRHLFPGMQGRNKDFVHAILEFVIENKELFSQYKESKVRFMMRRANYLAGYKVFTALSKDDIKKRIFNKYIKELENVKD